MPSSAETQRRQNLQQQAAELLFGDTRFTPDPWDVASLIGQGLQEEDILAAASSKGFGRPIMHETLDDLELILPYLQQSNDILAAEHPHDTPLFAARDAAPLYYDFAIRYGDRKSYLLPASSSLWTSEDMLQSKDGNSIGAKFLSQFGLAREVVQGGKDKFVLVDSGWFGLIGRLLSYRLEEMHDASMTWLGSLTVRLISTRTGAIGQQLLGADAPRLKTARYNRLYGRFSDYPKKFSNTFGIGLSLQLLPDYHGEYERLEKMGDHVVALPRDEAIDEDVDRAAKGHNTPIVNPVAAAIVQYRVIRAALDDTVADKRRVTSSRRYGGPALRRLGGMAERIGHILPREDFSDYQGPPF